MAGSLSWALATRQSGYGIRPQAPSGMCCKAIRSQSMLLPSRRTAGSLCRALTTRQSRYGMRPQAPSSVCFMSYKAKTLLYGFSPFPLVVNISLPIVEPYGCLTATADVRITYLPQGLGLPTMTKTYSTSTQTIRTHLGLFRTASSFPRAEFHMPYSWIYQEGEICGSV